MGRIDTFKPKPLYGAWLMELAPSHNDPINELGWLWSKEKPATAYALARAVKSAEARRAGCRDKFDKQKFNSVALKLRNMLGYRGRLASIDMVNPGRNRRRNPDPVAAALAVPTPLTAPAAPAPATAAPAPAKKNPSLSKRRAAGKKRSLAKLMRDMRFDDKRNRRGLSLASRYTRFRKNPRATLAQIRRAKDWLKKHVAKGMDLDDAWGFKDEADYTRVAKYYQMRGKKRSYGRGTGHKRRGKSRKNPSAAWRKAIKARRAKWLKQRFGINPGRKGRTSRRKGARYVPTAGGRHMGKAMSWAKAKRYVRKSKKSWKRALGSARHHHYGMKRVNPKRSARTGRFIRRGRK